MPRIFLFCTLLLGLASCTLEDPAAGVDISRIISLEPESFSLQADGLDRSTLTATLGDLADANKDIVFTTERGQFAEADPQTPNTVTVTASGKTAQATLIAGTTVAEEVIVTARVSNFTAPQILNFTRAFPQDLTVVADKQTVSTDRVDAAQVTIQLFRDEGTPSDNTRIDLEVVPQDTAMAEVLPFVYTVGDVATVQVKSSNSLPGEVELQCSTAGPNGTTLMRSLTFTFE